MIYISVVIFAFVVIFLIVEHPYRMAVIYVFMVLYQFNIETFLPLDARGIILLLLFLRLYVFDKENMQNTNWMLFQDNKFWLIMVFTLTILIIPIVNFKGFILPIKDTVLNFISLILGFILVKNEEGKKSIIYGIILSGIFGTFDLLFTFFTTGTLNIIKLVDLLMGKMKVINHNYPGLLASMGLVFSYLSWYRTKISKLIIIPIAIFLFLGVFISTSRSALLATIIVVLLVTIFEYDIKHNLKKIIPISLVLVMVLVSFFFTYNLFFKNTNRNAFTDKLYYRLYEEPLQLIGNEKKAYNPWTGQQIKGSMTFRGERWKEDFNKYLNLELSDQLIGLGPKGYLKVSTTVYARDDNVYERLAPHNGFLMILLERGLLGLSIYFFISIIIIYSSFKKREAKMEQFPFIYLFILLIIYSFAQNSEMTSPLAYLIFGTILGNVIYYNYQFSNDYLS